MKLHLAIAALQLIPANRDAAISSAQFVERWKTSERPNRSERQLQRILVELVGEGLAQSVGPRGAQTFYRTANRTPAWAMTHETALRVLLSSQMLGPALQGLDNAGGAMIELADSVISTSVASQRLRSRIRVVPDGMGRLPAKIEPGVQKALTEAIAEARQLRITYRSRAALSADGRAKTHDLSVLGAVSKDGAIYLLATTGMDGEVRPFVLHRVESAEVLRTHILYEPPGFDLDDYIAQTHQLSHSIGTLELVDLRLRIHRDAIWHLRERPFCAGQTISDEPDQDGWYVVTATLPKTELLVPTLLSMCSWMIVDGPEVIRKDVVERLGGAIGRYRCGGGAP
jgi:predicted DNA-binding transcriptional regulator YafY